ncbi:hypothetical protein X474_15505 [Dethiosulfatarculus sandiegensis]|uniref:Uncharacterized protein n=1 Tax=Dethiosulfatarculus sandiegensis TaxID=1429043 RepID=A0A0D2JUH0_9BACT|nr:hypothetical protein X474_15505 [Dethiosulfatarculus sandiegensis]
MTYISRSIFQQPGTEKAYHEFLPSSFNPRGANKEQNPCKCLSLQPIGFVLACTAQKQTKQPEFIFIS